MRTGAVYSGVMDRGAMHTWSMTGAVGGRKACCVQGFTLQPEDKNVITKCFFFAVKQYRVKQRFNGVRAMECLC